LRFGGDEGMYEMVELGTLISQAKTVRCGDAEYPILSMTMRDGLVFQDNKFKKIVASKDKSDYKVVYRNQLVISFPIDEGVLAAQRIADAGIVSPAYGVWNIDQEKIQPEYLEYALRCNRAIGYYKANLRGSTARRRSLPTPTLLAFTVPLPTIAEQNRIINIIHEAKNILDNRKEMLSKLDELIRARFVEMFGDPISNPKHWDIIQMNECLDSIDNGKSFVCEAGVRIGDEPAILKLSAVTYGIYRPEENKKIIDKNDFIESAEVHEGDLLFTRKNTPELVGMAAYVASTPVNLMMPDLIFRLNTNDTCNKLFLWQLINHDLFRGQIQSIASGSAKSMSNISKERLGKLSIYLPPLELQNQFAAFVTQVNKSKLVEATTIIPKGGFLQWR
jgi:type I restriction enzyme S subunit